MQNLFSRMLGVLGVHGAIGALYWLLARYVLVVQDGLSADLLQRLDGDPARIGVYLGDVGGDLLTAAAASLVASALFAGAWVASVHLRPPYGDQNARARRGSWSALLIAALAVTAAVHWFRVTAGPTADLLAPGLGTKATLIAVASVLVAYWLSTALFAPASSRVAVPGAPMLGR